MSMTPDEMAPPSGSSVKFSEIGDTVEGSVVYIGDWDERVNKFNNKTEQVCRIGIDVGDGEPRYIWPTKGSGMAQAIANAMRDAQVSQLEVGQTLKLRFDEAIDTGKGNPFKKFLARVTPATAEQKAQQEAVKAAQEEPF